LETKRKGAFFKVFFNFTENQIFFAKIFPRLQDFLTRNKSYTGEKRFQSPALERQCKHWIKFYWMSRSDVLANAVKRNEAICLNNPML